MITQTRKRVMPNALAVPRRIEVYGDETLHRGPDAVLGGLWATATTADQVRSAIRDIRKLHGWSDTRGELKWVKCSGSRLHPVCRDVIDLVMSSLTAGRLEFRALVIEYAVLRHPQWHGGNPESAIYRAWQHLLSDPMVRGVPHDVRLDHRTTRDGDLVKLLNIHQPFVLSVPAGFPVARAAFHCSHTDEMLQVSDVLVGAIGSHARGGRGDAKPSPGKIALRQAIGYHLGGHDLATPRGRRPFQVTRITRFRPDPGSPLPTATLPILIERSASDRDVRLLKSHGSVGVAA